MPGSGPRAVGSLARRTRCASSRMHARRHTLVALLGALAAIGLIASCTAGGDGDAGAVGAAGVPTTLAVVAAPEITVTVQAVEPGTAPMTTPAPTPDTTTAPVVEVSEVTTTTVDPYIGFTRVPAAAVPIEALGSADGEATRLLQERLLALGFWLQSADGTYGTTTRQAVMAFQKYNLMEATGEVDQVTADAITNAPIRANASVREGDLVEINKLTQLLFIVRGGVTMWVINASTGNGLPFEEEDQNTPGKIVKDVALTPDGEFKVNREKPEGWWEGDLGKIYRPKYFKGGIAVHGSGNVPNYPASHGCVRVSVQAMDYIWEKDLIPMKSKVWVHA